MYFDTIGWRGLDYKPLTILWSAPLFQILDMYFMIADDFSYSMSKGLTIDSENRIYYSDNVYQESRIVILNSNGLVGLYKPGKCWSYKFHSG